MADFRESAGLQQLELVRFFPVDGLLAPPAYGGLRIPLVRPYAG
jgi:hypothetical protein